MSRFIRTATTDRVMVITIDRPEKRNAINAEMAERLRECWAEFNAGDALVAVIAGNDQAFTAGADLGETRPKAQGWLIHQAVPGVLVDVAKPVVSAVAGWCVGVGLYLAQATDLIIAADNTKFSYPEPKVGMGGSWVPTGTAARIPLKVAMELALVCEPISVERAYQVGMVNEVVPVGTQLDRAVEVARKIASHAPGAIRHVKHHVQTFGHHVGPDRACNAPDQLAVLSSAEEREEGMAAFREGRTPNWPTVTRP